jgi:hypothetical protein
MQDKYAGDIGDFGKFALLRTLAPDLRLGVCWYRVADETTGNDGRHRAYLDRQERFRALDEVVFEALKPLARHTTRRSIRILEQLGLLPGAVFHGVAVPRQSTSRETWFEAMRQTVRKCDLVFLDPDNGIAKSRSTHKSVSCAEISTLLGDSRTLLVYHHQTSMKGGAAVEARVLMRTLLSCGARRVQAIRLRPYSSRFYLLVNGSDVLHMRLETFAGRWGAEVELFKRLRR